MPEYKTIRLTAEVYNAIALRQLPRESMSEAVQRLIKTLDELCRWSKDMEDLIREAKVWNMTL